MLKTLIQASLFGVLLAPAAAMAQSGFDATWKVQLETAQLPKKPDVIIVQNGTYDCKSCVPPISVKADGQDHKVTGHPYFDTTNVTIVNDRTVAVTEKRNGNAVGTSKLTVSADGRTATLDFVDSSDTNAAPVTGKETLVRVAKGPAGAHATSGSWRATKVEGMSDNALLSTFKVEGDTLRMSTPTGQSYIAKLDGTEAPYHGDPGITTVSVKRVDQNTIEETDKRNGKAITVTRMTLSPDGKTLTFVLDDLLQGTRTRFVAVKQ